jgi:hypothetical protein
MEKGWKAVFMTESEYKATIAKDVLQNAGIKVVIMNQHDSAHQAFGDFFVYTPGENVEKALELLNSLKGE